MSLVLKKAILCLMTASFANFCFCFLWSYTLSNFWKGKCPTYLLLFFKLPQVQMGFEIYGFPNFKKIKVYLYHILCSITNTVLGLFHNKNILTFMKQHVHSPRVRNFKKLWMHTYTHIQIFVYVYVFSHSVMCYSLWPHGI